MADLAPIIIPAATALTGALAATAASLAATRERPSQRIERLANAAESVADPSLQSKLIRTIDEELAVLNRYREKRLISRSIVILTALALSTLGMIVFYASGFMTVDWAFVGFLLFSSGVFLLVMDTIDEAKQKDKATTKVLVSTDPGKDEES